MRLSPLSLEHHPRGRSWLIVPILTVTMLVACGSAGDPSTEGAAARVSPPEPTSSTSQERLPPPGEAWVIFGADTVGVELARSGAEREAGLMYREELPEGRGMLFVFQDAQIRSFWMRNTLIPLDIAYIDEMLTIIDIQAMEPDTEDPHPSARPAMFALEVPLGWFAKKGIRPGAQAKVVFGPG